MKRRAKRSNIDYSDKQSVGQAIFDAQARKKELHAILDDYDKLNDLSLYDVSLSLFAYDAFSNHGVLAVDGGIFEQPQQWLDTILYISYLSEYHDIDYDIRHWQKALN